MKGLCSPLSWALIRAILPLGWMIVKCMMDGDVGAWRREKIITQRAKTERRRWLHTKLIARGYIDLYSLTLDLYSRYLYS